jgi:taurine dioxygenase
MGYERVTVRELSTALGAEIQGVDVSAGLDEATKRDLQAAWADHQVIVLRDQSPSVEQTLDLARIFGTPRGSKKLPVYDPAYPDVSVIENDGSKTAVGNLMHCDNTDYAEPPRGCIMFAEAMPSVGGDTIWASMSAAYDALTAAMKSFLLPLTALHDNSLVAATYYGQDQLQAQGLEVPPANEHPVVRTHPVTGKRGLFVNRAYTRKIVQLADTESRALLNFLFEHIETPEFQVRIRWEQGTIVVWDNRITQHYALDDYNQLRRMRRVSLAGDRPYLTA